MGGLPQLTLNEATAGDLAARPTLIWTIWAGPMSKTVTCVTKKVRSFQVWCFSKRAKRWFILTIPRAQMLLFNHCGRPKIAAGKSNVTLSPITKRLIHFLPGP